SLVELQVGQPITLGVGLLVCVVRQLSQVEDRSIIGGRQLRGFGQMRFGLAWILRIEEGYPQVVEGLREVGRDLERILERRDSLVHVFLHNKRTPKVVVGKNVGGIEGDR